VAVARHRVFGELEDQSAEGLIFHLLDRIAQEVTAEEDVGSLVLAVENGFSQFRQKGRAALDNGRIRAARPEGVLIEHDLLFVGLAPDQSPEPAVADGKRGVPRRGGMGVPDDPGGIRSGRFVALGRERGRGEGRDRRGEHEACEQILFHNPSCGSGRRSGMIIAERRNESERTFIEAARQTSAAGPPWT
jgi:hypothetical protein